MSKFKPEALTEDEASVLFDSDEHMRTEIVRHREDIFGSETLRPFNRQYKASLFEQIFNSKSEALSLYNAINGTAYADENEIIVTTLEGALFMGYRNDVSFLVGCELNLYEHQSSYNPNMPVRGLNYFAQLYQNYVKSRGLDVYSSVRLSLPMAQYYVFYNGTDAQPDRQLLRLSDMFPETKHTPHLEVVAVMLNINYGHNRELMERCRTLHDYAVFVAKVREYIAQGYQRAKAAEIAMHECIRKDILKEFLIRNQAGVTQMLFDEDDWNFHLQKVREAECAKARKDGMEQGLQEGLQEGLQQGMQQGLQQGMQQGWSTAVMELLSIKGEIPDEVRERIMQEEDISVLRRWFGVASAASDVAVFVSELQKE